MQSVVPERAAKAENSICTCGKITTTNIALPCAALPASACVHALHPLSRGVGTRRRGLPSRNAMTLQSKVRSTHASRCSNVCKVSGLDTVCWPTCLTTKQTRIVLSMACTVLSPKERLRVGRFAERARRKKHGG